MRVAGLLFILVGCVILMLPTLGQLLHRTWRLDDGSLIGGALLCVGLAALILSRSTADR